MFVIIDHSCKQSSIEENIPRYTLYIYTYQVVVFFFNSSFGSKFEHDNVHAALHIKWTANEQGNEWRTRKLIVVVVFIFTFKITKFKYIFSHICNIARTQLTLVKYANSIQSNCTSNFTLDAIYSQLLFDI